MDFSQRLVLIGGTSYAGETKKSAFTIMNYLLPQRGVMSMHCSANVGADRDVAIFFGLSGTGKTTLSADPERRLIGDDEHGWSDDGVFNFEGGCYAKVIKLSAEAEPDIYRTTKMFGTILENVVYDPATRQIDLDDARKTENTRASYPLTSINNIVPEGHGGHPRNIIMLTADAFGVLPPVARLSPEQAMYHFLSGYTAKVAGTERGITEPQATFSTCFGAPFMVLHPGVYADLLGKHMAQHNAACWLVNTGWSGGPYGVGKRMKIGYRDLIARLRQRYSLAQLTIHEGDALAFDFARLDRPLRVVGNLPYNISTPLLFHLAAFAAGVKDMTFMLQKEVVMRMVAEPGTADYGRLSVMLQYRFRMGRLFDVPPGAFRPSPQVTSSIVRMLPLPPEQLAARDEALLGRIVAAAFGQRRKTLRNTLRDFLKEADFAALELDPGLRGERLGVADFVAIANHCARRAQ